MKYNRIQGIQIWRAVGLLLLFTVGLSASGYAQDGKLADFYLDKVSTEDIKRTTDAKLKTMVVLKKGSQELAQALQSIARQTGLKLSYSEQVIPHQRKVTIKKARLPAEQALWDILEGTGFRFGISASGQLVLVRMQQLSSVSQQETITGTVTDGQTRETLPGVNILVKGTSTGTSTDSEGNFELTVESLQDTLVVSFIGYQTQEVPIQGQTEITIEMQSQAILGEEMVVTGYSTQRKEDVIGSVDVVDVETMQNIPTGSAQEALQGSASGVNIYNTGSPGESSNVFIRGVSSFGDSSPLVLIDGVEGSLDDVLPSNIESLQVLKDAGAAAIYGVRGSNGVVLITTKKGSRDTPVSISYSSYTGVTMPLSGNPYNLMNPQDQMEVMLEANPNNPLYENGLPDYFYAGPDGSGVAQEGDPEVDPSLYNLDRQDPSSTYLIAKANKEGTNWYQEVFDPAIMQNHNVSMRGGLKMQHICCQWDT